MTEPLSSPVAPGPASALGGVRVAARRVGSALLFAVLPAAVVISMFAVAIAGGPLALDFHQELYPQAKELLDGRNPFPEAIWPPFAAAVAAPFTIFPPGVADVLIAVTGPLCIGAALWLVGVRDWRVYGVAAMWPQVIAEIRISHLTPLLCLLLAVAWRYREAEVKAGVALGMAGAIKFFVWPVGIWLLATRRTKAAAVAAVLAAGSLLLVLPFAGLDDYLRTVFRVSREFDQDSYSSYGLLTQLGVGSTAARTVTIAFGLALLVATWRRCNFALAVAAALVLSPIVWLDYYALAIVPLAVARPRLSAVWFVPLLTWGLPSSGIAADAIFGVGRVLLAFAVVLIVASRPPVLVVASRVAGSHTLEPRRGQGSF